jgi:hypothetical protein
MVAANWRGSEGAGQLPRREYCLTETGKHQKTPGLDPRPVLGYLFSTPGLSLQALPAFPRPLGAHSGQRSSLRNGGDRLRQIKLTLNVPLDLVQGCLRRNRPRPRAHGLDFKFRFPIHGPPSVQRLTFTLLISRDIVEEAAAPLT